MISATDKHQKVIETLLGRILPEFKDRIHSIVLFGSVARGEATKDSDIDLLIILPEPTFETKRRIDDIASGLGLEAGVFIEVVPFTTRGFEKDVRMRSWFSSDIVREGKVLYDDGTYGRIREADPRYLAGVSDR